MFFKFWSYYWLVWINGVIHYVKPAFKEKCYVECHCAGILLLLLLLIIIIIIINHHHRYCYSYITHHLFTKSFFPWLIEIDEIILTWGFIFSLYYHYFSYFYYDLLRGGSNEGSLDVMNTPDTRLNGKRAKRAKYKYKCKCTLVEVHRDTNKNI